MKNILLILGHPNKDSFCKALLDAYAKSAQNAGYNVRMRYIGDMTFDPILWKGYNVIQELESDLIDAQHDIKWANHIVFVYPTWWYTFPALLKGFFDRVFLPGFAFKFHTPRKWDKLLKGRSARLIVTMNAPRIYYRWIVKSPGHRMMKATLKFSGIKPIKITDIGSIESLGDEKRKKWIEKVAELGKKGK